MNIHLEQVTEHNVADLVQPAELRDTEFYPVPHDAETALKALERAIRVRKDNIGETFAGYDLDRGHLFVGCGEIDYLRGDISMGYWVVSALRGQGVGKAFRTELDHRARELFPGAHTMTAYIHYRNVSSAKIAESLGYVNTEETAFGSHLLYRKEL